MHRKIQTFPDLRHGSHWGA